MVTANYEFWTHGVNTIVEFPSRATEIRHAGWGTLVRQAANTDNWFHIALPSPRIIMDDEHVFIREIRLRAEVNENARVDYIHSRRDGELFFSQEVMFTDRTIDEVFQVDPNRPVQGGITLAIHIMFLTGTPIGQAIFRSAGALFR
jgi:hypothetical protein